MSTINEIRKNREQKIEKIEHQGGDPYPIEVKRTKTIAEFVKVFSGEDFLTGRIKTQRVHGGLTFISIEDGTGEIQAVLMRDKLGEDLYNDFQDIFDIGDFIQIRGIPFTTKRGEKSIELIDFKMLAKSIMPLPEKWHGLKDIEERYRKRYLDLIFSKETKDKFVIRSKVIKEIRRFLDENEFLEVETPIIQNMYGGARAKPFTTHLNAYDLDVFLRISPELYLKRLLIGGFEKIYEIGKCFRNEGVDKTHNPDFTMLEFYWAYSDYKQLMQLTEKLLKDVVKNVFGTDKIGEIDFSSEWERIEFYALFEKHTGIKYDEVNEEGLYKKAKELGVDVPKGADKGNIADEIYKKYCRAQIKNPTFVIHYPKEFQPLAKGFKNSNKLANFQLIINGAEIVNAFSELNDPIEQEKRLKNQEKLFEEGFDEAQRSDDEFVEALEYGMPPASGFGMGIDRLIMLLTESQNLREVILFPIMKSKE